MNKFSIASNRSDGCDIPCFDHVRATLIKATLARNEHIFPSLSEFYKLLGNIIRLKILFALAEHELCVCDIARILSRSVAATSHQLKLLRDQGWLRMRNDGKMVYYKLKNEKLLKALRDDLMMLEEKLN